MNREAFIIEHATRGTLREWDIEPDGSVKFYYSWSGYRNDPEKAHQFRTFDDAEAIYLGLPEKDRMKCTIRSSARDWEAITR